MEMVVPAYSLVAPHPPPPPPRGANGCRGIVATTDIIGSESTHIPSPETGEQGMVCFSCGRLGHGVSQCSHMDMVFTFLPPGWLFDFWDGQYRAVWPNDQPGPFGRETTTDLGRGGGGGGNLPDQQCMYFY